VIHVEGIGKRYRIGGGRRHDTLRDAIADRARRLVGRGGPKPAPAEFWALREVSFDVKEGEVVGIVGRNGAGKSTLLKIVSRITPPTEGRVRLNGRVASLLEVGTGFHPELTGRENIFLNGAILGMTRQEIRKKFDEIVAFSEVEKFLDTPVKHYSSGMYVRLAFAVAAHLEPEILIVDEVLAVGDTGFQKKCLGKMGEVAKGGRTVLFVSHNMAAVQKLCGRTVLLNDGRLLTQGDTDAVITEYVRSFQPSTQPVVELDGRTQADADARPTRLRLFGRGGRPTAQFLIGEPWTVVLEFQASRSLRSVIAGIGVTTMEGVPVVTYWSVPQDLEAGGYRVEFEVDGRFLSRDFSIAVGLSSMERSVYYRENCATVTVLEVAEGRQPLRAAGVGILAGNQDAKIERITG
jgi:lipopolysaccharide transport system ATP-binding protein